MIDRTIDALPEPAPHVLAEARRVPASRAEHDRLAESLPCLHAIELVAPPQPRPLGAKIRIASWNAERCKYLPESAALLAGIGADIVLLTEMDVGMVRSGNRNTPRELARSLASGYAFGIEYVELGLGDDREKAWHANQSNAIGLHGNAILSKAHSRSSLRHAAGRGRALVRGRAIDGGAPDRRAHGDCRHARCRRRAAARGVGPSRKQHRCG